MTATAAIAAQQTSPRFAVEAFHRQTPAGYVVDYWRVADGKTGMRADGTGKYETPEQAQRRCDEMTQTENTKH